MQLIVEHNFNSLNKSDIGSNSFISVDGKYIYHIGVTDFMETFSSKGYIARKINLDPKTYGDSIIKFLSKHMLI